MSVRTILRDKGAEVVTVAIGAGVIEAARLMAARKIAALVVTEGERIAGLVTQRDISDGLARHGAEIENLTVRSVLKRSFVSVSPSESAKRVMALMTLHRATHIPVLDGERLVGIVSIGDIVKDRLGDLELESSVLRDAYIAAH